MISPLKSSVLKDTTRVTASIRMVLFTGVNVRGTQLVPDVQGKKLRRSVVVKNKSNSSNLLVPLSDVKSRSHPSNTSRLDQIPKKALKARVRKLKKDLVALQKRFDRLKKRMEKYREIPIEIAPKSKLFLQEAMHVVLNDSDCRASLVNELLKFEAQECSGGRNDIDLEPTINLIMQQFRDLKHK